MVGWVSSGWVGYWLGQGGGSGKVALGNERLRLGDVQYNAVIIGRNCCYKDLTYMCKVSETINLIHL